MYTRIIDNRIERLIVMSNVNSLITTIYFSFIRIDQ